MHQKLLENASQHRREINLTFEQYMLFIRTVMHLEKIEDHITRTTTTYTLLSIQFFSLSLFL